MEARRLTKMALLTALYCVYQHGFHFHYHLVLFLVIALTLVATLTGLMLKPKEAFIVFFSIYFIRLNRGSRVCWWNVWVS